MSGLTDGALRSTYDVGAEREGKKGWDCGDTHTAGLREVANEASADVLARAEALMMAAARLEEAEGDKAAASAMYACVATLRQVAPMPYWDEPDHARWGDGR